MDSCLQISPAKEIVRNSETFFGNVRYFIYRMSEKVDYHSAEGLVQPHTYKNPCWHKQDNVIQLATRGFWPYMQAYVSIALHVYKNISIMAHSGITIFLFTENSWRLPDLSLEDFSCQTTSTVNLYSYEWYSSSPDVQHNFNRAIYHPQHNRRKLYSETKSPRQNVPKGSLKYLK